METPAPELIAASAAMDGTGMRAEANDQHRSALLGVLEQTRAELGALVRDRADAEPVTTDVATFRKLSVMLEALGREVRLCGGEDCFGRVSKSGVQWVVRDRLNQAEARAATAEATVEALRLQMINRTPDLF